MIKPIIKPIDDEWWTTAMVCAHMKLGTRALWDIRRDPVKRFPEAIKPGGKVNLFRASDVRDWMDGRLAAGVRSSVATIAPEPVDMVEPVAQAPDVRSEPAQAPVDPVPAKRRRKGASTVDVRQLELF